MIDRKYWNVGIVPINYGFIPVDPHGYKTKFAFDASGLTLYKVYKRIPNGQARNSLYLVLKGLLRYNITLETFRPCELSTIGESSNVTSFTVDGYMPVNSVLAVEDIEEYSSTEFTIKLCKKKHYISGADGSINSYNKYFGRLMRNSEISKSINVPFTVQFKPKPLGIVTAIDDVQFEMASVQDDQVNNGQINISQISAPTIDLTLISDKPNTFGYQYKDGKPLTFTTSIDGSNLEKVVEVEINPLTSQTQYRVSLVGQIFSNTTVNNLFPISTATVLSGISFIAQGVVKVNEELGVVTSEAELEGIVNTSPEVILNEVTIVAVTETGEIVEYDPTNPEEFFILFDGVSQHNFKITSNIVVVPTPVPFS